MIGKKESFYLFDYVSFTTRSHNEDEVKELLGLTGIHWEDGKGSYGYRNRYYFECISIHYNGTPEQGVWCEMTGQGCRAYETYGYGDYEMLFIVLLNPQNSINITRLDIAFDDHEELLDIKKIVEDTRKQNYVSCFRGYNWQGSETGLSVILGSKHSEVRIRIYDKAAEKKLTDGSHWVRVELQLRNERAEAFVERYMQNNNALQNTFLGIVSNYVRYIIPDKTEPNKWRLKMRPYWQRFLNGAEKVKLYKKPGVEYNLTQLENFAVNMAGNAVKAFIEIFGIHAYLNAIYSREYENPKYNNLIAKYKPDEYEAIHEFMQHSETAEQLYILDEKLGRLDIEQKEDELREYYNEGENDD